MLISCFIHFLIYADKSLFVATYHADYGLRFICHGFEPVVTIATAGSFGKRPWSSAPKGLFSLNENSELCKTRRAHDSKKGRANAYGDGATDHATTVRNHRFPQHHLICFQPVCPGESANAVPHYHKLCSRDSHIWGIRRGQHNRSAMAEPRPG